MPAAELLQVIGFLLAAAATAIAGFAIYVIHTGGRGLDDVIFRLISEFDLSPTTIATIGVVIAWGVGVLPGLLLLSNGLATEAQLRQNEETKKFTKKMDEIAATLEGIRSEARQNNQK